MYSEKKVSKIDIRKYQIAIISLQEEKYMVPIDLKIIKCNYLIF